jgi:putative tricarboxylic transport membrane protein
MSLNEQPSARQRRGLLKSPQDFAAGIFLLVIAAVGIVGSLELGFSTSSGVGPGMMPRAVGLLVAAFGVLLVVQGFLVEGEGLDRWSIRGLVFVLGSALVFAWTIRPLGLIVAGPLAVIISAFADRQTRWIEVIVFGFVMTGFCIALFSYALNLPIPIMPTALPDLPFALSFKI